jgi:hypothetical protein
VTTPPPPPPGPPGPGDDPKGQQPGQFPPYGGSGGQFPPPPGGSSGGYPPPPGGYPPPGGSGGQFPPPPPGGQSGSGYGPPPFPGGSDQYSAPPKTYLVWSILVTIFCCLPLGIVAIIKSTKVNALWAQGRPDEARSTADSARKWVIASAILGVIATAVYVAYILSMGNTDTY